MTEIKVTWLHKILKNQIPFSDLNISKDCSDEPHTLKEKCNGLIMSKNKQTNKQTKQNKTKNLSKIFQGLHLRSVKISPILSYPEFFRSFLTSLVFFHPTKPLL